MNRAPKINRATNEIRDFSIQFNFMANFTFSKENDFAKISGSVAQMFFF